MAINLKKIASSNFNVNSLAQNSNIVPNIDTSGVGGKFAKIKSIASMDNQSFDVPEIDAAKNKDIGLMASSAQKSLSMGGGGLGALEASIESSLQNIGTDAIAGLSKDLVKGFVTSLKLPKLNLPALPKLPSIGGLF